MSGRNTYLLAHPEPDVPGGAYGHFGLIGRAMKIVTL
jgi:hypothetical protein